MARATHIAAIRDLICGHATFVWMVIGMFHADLKNVLTKIMMT
jgi:hypothetical protein